MFTFKELIPALTTLVAAIWIFPYILELAKSKNIVDEPNARKLQRSPIPILGGMSVIFGLITGITSYCMIGYHGFLLQVFIAMVVIFIIGLIDDIIDLSARVKMIIEILLVLSIIYGSGLQINDLNGLWNVTRLPNPISVPLTVFACVGIINAINLIDGVDGYSSGYCIMACILFGVMFYMIGDMQMVVLATMIAGALIPFFGHNVFGKISKMFIGDAGTLSIGILMSTFVMKLMSQSSDISSLDPNLGLIPFSLAVMCVPIFDTLRVMGRRIIKGKSPFHPDKTHLHHMFIAYNFSHIGTTTSILCLNLFVVACWFAAYRLGASIDIQLYLVVGLGLLVTFGVYDILEIQLRKKTRLGEIIRKLGDKTHFSREGFWLHLQRLIDNSSDKDIKNHNAA